MLHLNPTGGRRLAPIIDRGGTFDLLIGFDRIDTDGRFISFVANGRLLVDHARKIVAFGISGISGIPFRMGT